MKFTSVVSTAAIALILSLLGSAQAATFQYRCIHPRAKTEAESRFVAEIALGKTSAQVRVLKNTDKAPPNWKLSRGEVIHFLPQTGRLGEHARRHGYIPLASRNKVGSPVDIRFFEYDFGDRDLEIAWSIEALPAIDEDGDGEEDDVARGTSGTWRCFLHY